MSEHIARIVPASPGPGTQGTMVWVGDHQLSGITKIELVAEVNDVWRAVIHCAAIPEELLAEAAFCEQTE